jgi:hypothetical protein
MENSTQEPSTPTSPDEQADDAADLAAIDAAQHASAAAGETPIPWDQAKQQLGIIDTNPATSTTTTTETGHLEEAHVAPPTPAPSVTSSPEDLLYEEGEVLIDHSTDARSVKEKVEDFLATVEEDVKEAIHHAVLATIDALGRGGSISHDETSTTVMGWRNGSRVYGHGVNTAAALADFTKQADE